MPAGGAAPSSLAAAAAPAFDVGAIVIAANGNFGPAAGTVNGPANAHKVLGIGAYDVETLATPDYQSRGPTADGRIKPDFQMPTNTESATTACNTCVRPFGGTSGATPYGGAAAILLRHWFDSLGLGVEPGKLYAGLLAFGNHPYPYDNTEGAGDMVLGNLYCRRWMTGSRTISGGQTLDIPFATVASQWDLQVAIWWPEGTTYHNDVDLYVVDPAGSYRAAAISSLSVFEVTRVNGNLSPAGTWNLRMYGYSVPTGPQTVYYMIYHKVLGCGG
jgi:subtilisin family serine protease